MATFTTDAQVQAEVRHIEAGMVPATESQMRYIKILARERGVHVETAVAQATSKAVASKAIDALRAMPKINSQPAVAETPAAQVSQVHTEIWPGIYTLTLAEGHRTFRVRVQRTDADFAPGKTIIEYLSGPDNERDYTGLGFVCGGRLQVWKSRQGQTAAISDAEALLADPTKAEVSKRCIRCNRTLTTPESLAAGIGPDCAGRGW